VHSLVKIILMDIFLFTILLWERCSSVGIVIKLGARQFWCAVARRIKSFSSPKRPRVPVGPTQLAIKWIPGVLYWGVKRPAGGADHLLPSGADLKNKW
jgi:hypothetical protein